MLTLKAFIALVVTWCLLAVAAVVAASTQRFEGLFMYLVAAVVLIGLVICRCDCDGAVIAHEEPPPTPPGATSAATLKTPPRDTRAREAQADLFFKRVP